MLIQFLSDVTRNKKLIGEFINSPEKVLKRYPAITKAQARLLMKRDLAAVSAAAGQEVAKHFSGARYSLMYVGVDVSFSSLDPASHKINDPVDMTMVLDVKQAPTDFDLKSSVDFNYRSSKTSAKVLSTVLNKAKRTITIKMNATFTKTGKHNAYVNIWVSGRPDEHIDLTTKNIFTATAR